MHRTLDVAAADFDGLHVQAPLGDEAIANEQYDDPSHREHRAINVVTSPTPLAPLRVAIDRGCHQLAGEVRRPIEDRRPVLEYLCAPTKPSTRVRGLRADVVPSKERRKSLSVVSVHRLAQ